MSQEGGVGEGIPPRFLFKSHFAQFLVNSRRFIPHVVFLKGGEGVPPGEEVPQLVLLLRWGCHLS